MEAEKRVEDTNISVLIKLRDLDERVKDALRAEDTTLVHSFALQLDYLLKSAILSWPSPSSGLMPLLAEFQAFSPTYMKKDKLQLLRYLSDCAHRLLVTVDETSKLGNGDAVLPYSLFEGTREYLERIVRQINGCYASGWYDACAVMIRRLVETLVIEAFESHKIESKIKDSTGDYLRLRDLVTKALNEPAWNLGRNVKKILPRLKDVGDLSAHSRRFIAQREDIEKIMLDLRVVAQEFIFLAALK